jgi:sn-glycerol 3-phosphate transport system substrate-binding protein
MIIPRGNSAFKFMTDAGFYKDPKYAGRELAIESLTATPPSPNSRGIRLGNFTQIRAEVRAELEAAFTGKKDMQVALDDAATRGNAILRRFEQTFKGKQLP